jgi:hypothetical protein
VVAPVQPDVARALDLLRGLRDDRFTDAWFELLRTVNEPEALRAVFLGMATITTWLASVGGAHDPWDVLEVVERMWPLVEAERAVDAIAADG